MKKIMKKFIVKTSMKLGLLRLKFKFLRYRIKNWFLERKHKAVFEMINSSRVATKKIDAFEKDE